MGANSRLWKLDWDHVDFMNLLNRHRAVPFDFDTLQRDYWTHQGRRCSWIDWMNDQSISARKAIERVLKHDGWEWRDGQWRKWPLVASLPTFDQPWREYKLGEEEFNPEKPSLVEYFKHLQHQYAGEVALVWGEWGEVGEGASAVGDLPRNARLWDPQFARQREQARAMRQLPFTGWGDARGDMRRSSMTSTCGRQWGTPRSSVFATAPTAIGV